MTRAEDLLKDVKQMVAQWRDEAPGGRKAWPKSIRDRVLELSRLGMGSTAIAQATGLTYFTIHGWKKRRPEFRAVAIAKSATVTVPMPTKNIATVTVTTAKGLKFEGITFEQALVVAKEMR